MIIAEIGQNHCRDIVLAIQLLEEAKRCGADLAKFQLYDHDKLYRNRSIPDCALTYEEAKYLFDCGKFLGLEVFFSVFDLEKIEWCERMGVNRYKVAYSQKDNTELLDAIEQTGKPAFVSGVDFLCVPKYPAEIQEYIPEFDNYKGVSDHTIGLTIARLTLQHGKILEKHFAIDDKTGVDAPWSMTPEELEELVEWENICGRKGK